MMRTRHQKTAYALRRMSRAVDRAIVAQSAEQKHSHARWVALWAKAAGVPV